MKTISIPTNDRLNHLRRVLDSVRVALSVNNGWTIVFSCEPVPSVCSAVSSVNWAPIYFQRNAVKMGCWSNTFRAADFAMAVGSTFNLYIEDDTVISPDTLALADQWRLSNRPGLLALRRPEAALKSGVANVERLDGGLFGDGFAWRKEQWPIVRECWWTTSRHGYSMWDWSMEDGLKARGIPQMRPCLNRSQNIGVLGTHQNGFDPNRHSPCYSGPPVKDFQFL